MAARWSGCGSSAVAAAGLVGLRRDRLLVVVVSSLEGAFPALRGRDFGGALTQYVVGYLREHTPEGTLEEVFRLAGETRSAEMLSDVNAWSSYGQYRRLLEATGRLLGGPDALKTVGSHAFDSIRNSEMTETFRALGSPTAVYEALIGVTASTAPGFAMMMDPIGPNECRIRLRMREPNEPFREHCSFQLGLLTTIAQIFGYPPAEILDEVCQCDGVPSCSARMRWEPTDEDAARAARAELRTRLLEARLDELQRTVAELVSGDGLEAVLTRVVAAARRAVLAPSFVLDVRAYGTSERFVHTEGVGVTEGARLTEEIRGGSWAQQAPNVLVSEVVSERRHYGHLVAIRPETVAFEARERSVLDSYARLAASALDTEAAIVDARQQATAAEALLALSSSLADLGTSQEMLGRLARAVPSVIDCDRVLVLLTDPARHTFRVQATYGFDHGTEVDLRRLEIPAPLQRQEPPGFHRHPAPGELGGLYPVLESAGSVRACSFPITSNSDMLGWITIDVTSRPERLDGDAAITARLRGLAGQAAIAIRNARLLDEIRHQALHDNLTGLPNRALIIDRVSQAIARARRDQHEVALLFVDLDGFKDVNDSLGHGAGDQLLRSVAARLSATLRDSDTVARLGGDEFVVLAEGLSLAAGPELVAERLLGVLGEPFQLGDDNSTSMSVTASVGIAVGLRDTAEELFRDADIALYAAKAAGKNRYTVFEARMGDALRSRHEIEMDLQAAVGTDQFFLLYQPIFDLATMAVVGVEALLRWNHPIRGLLQPDEFIPALEASGLIIPVGRWVLHQACRQAMVWRAHGQHTNMSVNASGRQLDAATLLDDVRHALSQSGLPPDSLTIEITETCLMRDTQGAIRQLSALKTLGVRIAIDDFGTGYSSLAYLQQFPVDSLKIDKSFISGMAKSPEGDALIHTLIQLGKALNIETLAEGIEENDQLTQLQTEHCEVGQGYLFALPLTPDQVEEFLDPAGTPLLPPAVLTATVV